MQNFLNKIHYVKYIGPSTKLLCTVIYNDSTLHPLETKSQVNFEHRVKRMSQIGSCAR